jgi:hypothetical protein
MLESFKKNSLSNEQMKSVNGGGACQNLNNCYASRDGACIYSNNYGTCMQNQAAACDSTFLFACAME